MDHGSFLFLFFLLCFGNNMKMILLTLSLRTKIHQGQDSRDWGVMALFVIKPMSSCERKSIKWFFAKLHQLYRKCTFSFMFSSKQIYNVLCSLIKSCLCDSHNNIYKIKQKYFILTLIIISISLLSLLTVWNDYLYKSKVRVTVRGCKTWIKTLIMLVLHLREKLTVTVWDYLISWLDFC